MSTDLAPKPIVFFLNLDRSTDRLQRFLHLNRGLDIDLRRIVAVDGKQVDSPPVDLAGYAFRNTVATPRVGEIGCYLSHLKAYEALLATEAEWAIIMEDDCVLEAEALNVLEAIASKDDWDVVKLFYWHSGMPIKVRRLSEDHALCIQCMRTTSAACYMIRREAAQRFLHSLRQIREPIDHAIDRPWEEGMRVRSVKPCVAKLAPAGPHRISTIGYKGQRTRQSLAKRAVIKSYKGWQEIRRFSCALKEFVFAKLG